MDSAEVLVLCSSQPGFLRNLGTRLVGRCRLLECYSLTEAAQMIQLHHPRIALIDLRRADVLQFDRSFAMAQNSDTTYLVLVTKADELQESQIPQELAHRVVCVEAEDNANPDAAVKTVEDIMDGLRTGRISQAGSSTSAVDASGSESLADKYRTRAPELRAMLQRLQVAARHDVTILLIGETGSGKTHLARLIHEASNRSSNPLLTVACGALPGDLIESELFGHVKGAFTGAHADKVGKFLAAGDGTILLDEIDVLTPEQQVKLLRVIEKGLYEPVGSNETHQVKARLIAASNLELQPLVESGRFRPDLYYRLNTLSFRIPPLRERLPDIEPLARYFVHRHAENFGIEITEITQDFIDSLIRYPWPGNVREMENAIRSAVIYCNEGEMTKQVLPPNVISGSAGPANDPSVASLFGGPTAKSLNNRIELTEKDIIEQALVSNSFSRTKTAKQLGISRVTLYNKMKKYGMMPAK